MTGWIVFLLAAGIAAALAAAWRGGAAAAREKNTREDTNDAHKAHILRDRLRHDDDFAKRVRKRFTR
jgi:hypothetical protein